MKTLSRTDRIYTIVTVEGREQWFCSYTEAIELFTLKATEVGDRLTVADNRLVAWYGEHGVTVL